ncbi:MAG: hypothetical protein JXJ20_02835 [Anaerolineae bacterium]|nr:hypothetical protein [Anaerolineae bacterium]
MRFLFTTQPLVGHFHAMVPLAQAVKDHGHEVAFATGEGFCRIVKQAGFDCFPCGRNWFSSRDTFADLSEWPAIQAAVSHPAIQQIWGFILGFGPQMADDLIELMSRWKPDMIVREPVEFGGYVAAELFDVPHASIKWAVYITPRHGCVEPLTELRLRHGLPEEPGLESFDRYFVLTTMPPSWQFIDPTPPVVSHRFCMPPFDHSIKRDLPAWVHTLPDQPTIYATLGTTFNQAPDRFQALIAALSTEDFNTIITVGESMDPAQFHPLPPHVKIEQYIPQTLILPYCDALIFHGGFNSLHSALWHGLPVVITPLEGGDQRITGQQCVGLGMGVMVEGEPPEPEAVRSAVKAVLDQPSYRQRAQELQREIKALPSLSEAVQRLEILARTHEPQVNEHLL